MLGQRLEHFGNRRVPAPTLRGPEGKKDEAETASQNAAEEETEMEALWEEREKWVIIQTLPRIIFTVGREGKGGKIVGMCVKNHRLGKKLLGIHFRGKDRGWGEETTSNRFPMEG